jgi:hypothetical protein
MPRIPFLASLFNRLCLSLSGSARERKTDGAAQPAQLNERGLPHLTAHRTLPTAHCSGSARLSTLIVAFILISVAASAFVVVRGRAAGIILMTTAGGGAWTPETSGVSVELRRVFLVNANVGYAVGANGTILKPFDDVAPPTLGNYPDTTVQAGANTTVTPDAAPTNTTSMNVSTTSAFTGTFAASPATGVVQVTNAQPARTYTVTVTAFNSVGATTTRTFTLTVNNPTTCVNATFSAASGSPFGVGTNPHSVGVGDFNGDGKQDLATANFLDNVTVLLGNGSGGFTEASSSPFAVGNNPASGAVGDFNGDGKLDLTTANYDSNNVTVLLGDGSGGFSEASGSPFAVNTSPHSVAVGDFNGDGKLDLTTANAGSSNVTVLLGDGSGGFSPATGSPFAVGSVPLFVAVGDFNGDGNQDLTTANFNSNNVTVLLGDGSGGFSAASGSPFAVGNNPALVALGDFNGDGKQDLAIANRDSSNVTVLLGNGSGGFSPASGSPFAVGTNPYSVVVGDFNGDGKLDLATANDAVNNVTVLLGDGSGGFSEASGSPFAVGTGPRSMAVGDFNGDGKLDLTTANINSGNVTVLLNTCTLNTAPTISAVGVIRQQGSPSANATIANVNDLEDLETALIVTVNGGASATVNGVTVSGISVDAAGVVTADVIADCTATSASFTLRVTDTLASFNEATLTVTVNPNTAPTLTYASPQSVVFGGSLNLSPSATGDNGAVTYSVQAGHGLTTAPTVDSSGVVSITNAQPAGAHTVTIRATDNCGTFTDATFTLNVDAAPTFAIDDVTHNEGDAGTTSYTFTVTKTGSTALSSSVNFNTQDGSATLADNDYQTNSGTLNFGPTDTSAQITVLVNGDTNFEPTEAFTVHLSGASGATIADADGTGTITNDDTCAVFNTVYVDDNWVGTAPGTDPDGAGPATNFGCDSFATIQGGVDGVASGGSVIVNAGTYTEYVTIAQPLTLNGAGAATVTAIPPTSDPNCGGAGGGSLCGASNLILVQASNVTISGLTLDGDNSTLPGGINVGGANVDARNGIITNHNIGIFENLVVHHVTVKNVFLRGLYASSGGSFNFHHNTVQNVAGDAGSSIAMFNFGGVGTFDNNTVIDSNDGIISNASLGTQYTNNHVTNCGGGIHTDNAGDGPIVSNDLISGNIVDNSPLGGYGIFAYEPRATVTIQNNTVTNVDNGLASFGRLPSTGNIKEGPAQSGSSATARPRVIDVREPGAFFLKHRAGSSPSGSISPDATIFTGNTVNAQGKANSTGVILTTDQLGNGSGDAGITFNQNTVIANTTGVSLEAQDGFTLTVAAAFNRIVSTTTAYSSTVGGTLNATMENNWWGCNAGPGNAGCGAISGTGVDFNPWILLGVSASPNPIGPGGTSTVTADMTHNSDTLVPVGTLPNMPVAFSATEGTMAPPTGTITAGQASSTFTSTSTSSGTGCATVDNQLICTPITINVPSFAIDDVTHNEGDAGTTSYTFTVTKTGSTALSSSVNFNTQDGTATLADNDYQTNSGTLNFGPTDTSVQITVLVNGDTNFEPNEAFTVHLSNASGATIADADGTGTITNDDSPSISGHLNYADGITPGKNVTMTLTGNNGFVTRMTTTDSNGDYTFTSVPVGNDYTVTPSRTPEAHDASITAFDASLAARFAAQLITLTTNQQTAGDASNNGGVSAFDASMIARYGVSIPAPGSIAGAWKFTPASLSFTNLSANQTNQNLSAILVGDISGNWTPPAGSSMMRSPSGGTAIPVGLPDRHDPPGGPSTINITVGDLTNQNVFSYDFDMTFDPTVLQPQNPAFDATGTLSSGLAINANTSTPGHVMINAFSSSNPMAGQGILLKLKFNVVGAEGSQTPLTWVSFNFNEGNPPDADFNGQFTATGPTAAPALVSGRITTPDGSPLGGAVMHLSGAASRTTISDSAGNYRFENVQTDNFYTVTPALANYSFAPASRSFSLVGNMTDAGFTANPDAVQSANAIDTTEYFVRQQYLDFLGREPDQGGLDYWSDQINQCGGDAACISRKRLDVSAAFFMSAEFQQTGSYIYGVYAGTLGRTLNYGEFNADRSQVLGGSGLDPAKTAFAQAFVQRPEFTNRYPQGMTREQFVDAVIQTMTTRSGVDQSSLRNQLLGDYDAGGRALVVRHASEASSFVAAEYNKAFVLMEYFGYLRREIDQGGYDYWLDVLNNGAAGNYRGMVCAFLTSTEYQLRFSTVVTHSNADCSSVQ